MRCILLTIAAAASTLAQSTNPTVIDYTKVPDCARQCTILDQAEKGCVPPAAPVTNQDTYHSCFCLSALLTGLKSSGALCQQAGCSADDANKISQYYVGLCNGPAQPPANQAQPTSTTATSAATTTSVTGIATAGAAGNSLSSTEEEQSWIQGHWKWIVMVGVIAIAIVVIWVGGVCLKRRYDRKKDAERANMAARDAPFNPSPHDSHIPSASGALPNSSSHSVPLPMAMSSLNSRAMDSGIGGIAPPRGQNTRVRSRTNTLQSLGMGNGSRTNLSPVVLGPHQHQAFANGSYHDSVPPSPSSIPPTPIFRNRDAMASEPQLANYNATQNPYGNGDQLPDMAQIRSSRALNNARIVSFVQSDPALHERINAEAQSAQIDNVAPKETQLAHEGAESLIQKRFQETGRTSPVARPRAEEPVPEYPPPTMEELEARFQARIRATGKPNLPMPPRHLPRY